MRGEHADAKHDGRETTDGADEGENLLGREVASDLGLVVSPAMLSFSKRSILG